MANFMLCIDGMEEAGAPAPMLPTRGLLAQGTVSTVPQGAVADSLGCILRLLGSVERDIPTGRAALEALAIGLPLQPDDAVLRCTLCRVENGAIAPATREASEMLPSVPLPEGWTLVPMSGYRCLLRIAGGAAQLPELTTLPPHQYFGCPVDALLPQGGALGEALVAFIRASAHVLPQHILLPWGQSAPCTLPSFTSRTGVHAAMVCHADIVRGIAHALQMDCPPIVGATGDTDTDLHAKYAAARVLARDHDLVVIHINGCDEAGHRREHVQKYMFRDRVLREIFEPLYGALDVGERLLLCADHQTDSTTGAHGNAPVSFWIYESGDCATKRYEFEDASAPLRLLLGREER